MTLVIENLRLAELFAVVRQNKPFYLDFVGYLETQGYNSLHSFVVESDGNKASATILRYFERAVPLGINLFDGIARPYKSEKAKWLFLAWVLRDAPAQRLQPMLGSIEAPTLNQRKTKILNEIREHVAIVLPEPERWTWETVSEVMADRLEGSRRAIKGTLFEAIVRRVLEELLAEYQINVDVNDAEIRLEGETFDVSVKGELGSILIPVKTRETMGGGHALLFTRDIHKAISAAREANMDCIPIVIAESWAGDLQSLGCEHYIYIDTNPNQILLVEPKLRNELEKLMAVFSRLTH